MELQELLSLNSEGLIPGPGESERQFHERVEKTKVFFHAQSDSIPSHHWQWPAEQLKTLFDFAPNWCAASYSSKGLAPWQAAATWIDVKRIYMIRLRPSRWVSRLIDPNEVLAHEAAHAARAAFNEPKYEELFAYLTSSSKWRRILGPLFQAPREAMLFVCLLALGSLGQIIELAFEINLLSQLWFIAAFGLCFFWSLRLLKNRMRLERAAKKLTPYLKDPAMARSVLFRMTDAEIQELANSSLFQPGTDLRWKILKTAYWKDGHDTVN